MEFTETHIARLVLGYLKSENCKPVYREFLRTSPHLRDEALGGRVIVTRVFGMRLIDYLNEYTEIYTIVQGKLEGTDYFNEHSRGTLVEQILYLLDKISCSRSSTPCTSTPLEHSSDVEATPAHTLPGNVGYDDTESPRTPQRVACSPGDDPETIEVLARTLLENKEFTEKLAHTINVVRNSPEFVDKKIEEHISAGACEELEATIKTVVRKTEEDPLFEKILDEIIGPQPLSTSREKPCQSTQNLNFQTMEEQNNEAIRSIIVASSSQQSQSSTYNPDVIVFDGNMDNYIKTNNTAVPTPVQQNYANSGLFVVPNKKYDPSKQILVVNQPIVNMPKNQPANTIISEQDILAMPTVILNDGGQNSSVVTSQPPIFITKPTYTTTKKPVPIIPNGLICDELHSNLGEFIKIYKSEEIPSNSVKTIKTIPPRVRAKSSKRKPPPPKTNPVKTITSASIHVTVVPEETPPKPKEEPLTVKTEPEQPPVNDVPVIAPEIKIEDKISPEETKETSTNKVQTAKNQTKTPQSRVFSKRTTPKSGSHVRNLNFSTPPKISSSERKRNADKSASPKFIHKKQAAKTLFKNECVVKKSPNKVVTRGPKPEWDSALRALACTGSEDLKSATPKRKQKQPPERGKRKARKTDTKLNASLDKEALLLEAALKTPIKEPPVDKSEIPKIKKEEPLTTIVEEESVKTTEDIAIDGDKNVVTDKLYSVEDNATKTILSPSKLNANKRNLVKTESKSKDDSHKLITPEMRDLKKDNPNFPIKANRNITPMLETPMKVDMVPKTPGLGTPLTGFTPLNKVLEDQLIGLDLNSIETPNLPITPGFPPFTPNVDLTTPYSNRPTDYSGSSSYYQPSDTEQNKSIEQLLEETSKKTTAPKKSTIKILDNVVIEPKVVLDNIVNNFNKNVIGKKNLNLLNKSSIKYSSSSDSESELSTDEGTTNQTVICKKENIAKEPTKTYSLRTRSSSNAVKDSETERTSEISNILNSVATSLSLESKPIKIMSHNEKVMLEMKEKRERMINKFKKSEVQKVEKPVNRTKRKLPQRGIKSVPQRKNRRKSDSPKKAINRTRRSTSLEEESPKFDKSFVNDFHLTSDEESEQPTKMETRSRRAKNVEEAAKVTTQEAETASDMEAEKLVSGLKQRGIHLMYKKSPKNLVPAPNATTQEEVKENKVVAESQQTPPKRIYSINEIDELDKVVFDQEIHVVFDETKTIDKKEYDPNILTKKVSAKVYCEEENIDIPVEIAAGPFISLLDFESKINVLIPKRKDSSKKEGDMSRSNDLNETNQKSNDGELQKNPEEVLTAVSLDVTTDDSNSSPKSSKKRKVKTEDESQLAKKSKTVENIKILKDLDVDVFLNKVHGRSENVT